MKIERRKIYFNFTESIVMVIGSDAGIICSCALLRYLYRSYGTNVVSTPYFIFIHFQNVKNNSKIGFC